MSDTSVEGRSVKRARIMTEIETLEPSIITIPPLLKNKLCNQPTLEEALKTYEKNISLYNDISIYLKNNERIRFDCNKIVSLNSIILSRSSFYTPSVIEKCKKDLKRMIDIVQLRQKENKYIYQHYTSFGNPDLKKEQFFTALFSGKNSSYYEEMTEKYRRYVRYIYLLLKLKKIDGAEGASCWDGAEGPSRREDAEGAEILEIAIFLSSLNDTIPKAQIV